MFGNSHFGTRPFADSDTVEAEVTVSQGGSTGGGGGYNWVRVGDSDKPDQERKKKKKKKKIALENIEALEEISLENIEVKNIEDNFNHLLLLKSSAIDGKISEIEASILLEKAKLMALRKKAALLLLL